MTYPRGRTLRQEILEGNPLTVRDGEVLLWAARGATAAVTAKKLYLSPDTVKGYRKDVVAKLGAKNLTQAVVRAIALGVVPIDEIEETPWP